MIDFGITIKASCIIGVVANGLMVLSGPLYGQELNQEYKGPTVPDAALHPYGFDLTPRVDFELENRWPGYGTAPNALYFWLVRQDRQEWLRDETRLIAALAHLSWDDRLTAIKMMQDFEDVHLSIFNKKSSPEARVLMAWRNFNKNPGKYPFCSFDPKPIMNEIVNNPLVPFVDAEFEPYLLRDFLSANCSDPGLGLRKDDYEPYWMKEFNGRIRLYEIGQYSLGENWLHFDRGDWLLTGGTKEKIKKSGANKKQIMARLDILCSSSEVNFYSRDFMYACGPKSFLEFFDLDNCEHRARAIGLAYENIGFVNDNLAGRDRLASSILGVSDGKIYRLETSIRYFASGPITDVSVSQITYVREEANSCFLMK